MTKAASTCLLRATPCAQRLSADVKCEPACRGRFFPLVAVTLVHSATRRFRDAGSHLAAQCNRFSAWRHACWQRSATSCGEEWRISIATSSGFSGR
jgi:hypothetical protein